MVNEDLVREIVSTYDLRPKLREKLTRSAIREITELGLNGADSVYRYIDDLVNKLQVRREEKLERSLTSTTGSNFSPRLPS